MTTTTAYITHDPKTVKANLIAMLSQEADRLFAEAYSDISPRDIEQMAAGVAQQVGTTLTTEAMTLRARYATDVDLAQRGLRPCDVSFRFDGHYCCSMTTTMGPICFPLAAYRVPTSEGRTTRVPARRLFRRFGRWHSSPLCLEWEARLGSMHPFRTAEHELFIFTHGAVAIEDTTIAAHTIAVGLLVPQRMLYRDPDEIREILRDNATQDPKTGKPIVYASCDAHVLRRFVDETWDAEWKNANGLRIWCIDRHTGDIIHLGGEFTWGDCHHVRTVVEQIIRAGVLPADGNYGDGVVAQVVWVTDGMPWFEQYLLPLFPTAVLVLDAFHLIERLARLAAVAYGRGKPEAKRLYKQSYEAAFGAPKLPRGKSKARRGHRKTKESRAVRVARRRAVEMERPRQPTTKAEALLNLLRSLELCGEGQKERDGLVKYVEHNAYRMDYAMYIQSGYQIGSGAMESLHPVASQHRLKRSGPGWRPEAAQAIFNLRMLDLVGRWHEFWSQSDVANTDEIELQAA